MLSQATPVLPGQAAAADRLHNRLTSWSASDNAFRILRDRVPGWDIEACLLKTAAVNQLYWTQVRLVWRMAVHISEVMKDPPNEPDLLVEAIALLPPREREKQYHFRSFASKLCHFFVDSNNFPVYDSFSCATVRYHLGRQRVGTGNPYAAFLGDVRRLLELSGLEGMPYRQLDRYLWLAGQYRAYLEGNAKISQDVRFMFENQSGEVKADLSILIGDAGCPSCR
ncbi:MAG TPA: hypothetical protein DCM14_08535 [Clostridiales bacterium UBA8153]|nr:hypothetical protein [Clostridiales bacterium UBA8153]